MWLLMLFFQLSSLSVGHSATKRELNLLRTSVEQKMFLEGCESGGQRVGAKTDSGEQDLPASIFCELILGYPDFAFYSPLFYSDRSCNGQPR